MKDVNQYRNELTSKISAIEMYIEGLNEGLSRATEVMQHAMLYKATGDLLNGGNHNE